MSSQTYPSHTRAQTPESVSVNAKRGVIKFLVVVAFASIVTTIWAPDVGGLAVVCVILLGSAVLLSALYPPDHRGRDLGDPCFLAGITFFLAFGARTLNNLQN